MGKTLRNETLGVVAILVATASFASLLYVNVSGGFAPVQLIAATIAALAMPAVLVGLAVEQRPGFSAWGQAGALVFAAGSVGLAFVALNASIAGVDGVVRNQLPRWSSASFGLGLVLLLLTLDGPTGFALAAEGLRDLGLFGMGLALLPIRPAHSRRVAPGV